MPICYFCKKELGDFEEYESHPVYQLDAFKVLGNARMHNECRENWEKDRIPIPDEFRYERVDPSHAD